MAWFTLGVMQTQLDRLKLIVGAVALTVMYSLPRPAQAETVDEMFERLQQPSVNSEAVEGRIQDEWSKSGSPSMDLLLQRGRAAMEAQDWPSAIGFFTALTDHAPEFAEGWNARATAYYHAGMIGPALADIRTTLRLNPRHFGALSGLALILEDLGHPEDAIEVWHQVERLTPYRATVKEAIERLDKELTGETL